MEERSGRPSVNQNKLVYYDTNIWVAYICGDDNATFHSKCEALFDDIEKGRTKAVVSYLVLSETLHTLRRKLIEGSPGEATPDDCENLVKKKTKEFREMIKRLKMQQKILLVPTATATTSLKDHYRAIWEKMLNTPFKVLTVSRCPRCRERLSKSFEGPCTKCGAAGGPWLQHRYGGLGHPDLVHAYTALQHNVSVFYTRDRAFWNLQYDPELVKMQINVIENQWPAQS